MAIPPISTARTAPAGAGGGASGEVRAPVPDAAASARFDRFLLGRLPDFFCFGPGATLLLAGLLLALQRAGGAASGAAATLTFCLVLLFVGPHYAATYRRAYTSLVVVRAHPWVTLAAPPILIALAILAVRHPASVGLCYFALYVGWSGYHYSGQSLGLAMLYPLRQGARLDPKEKRLVSLPLYVSWALSVLGLFRLAIPARSAAHELVRQAYSGPPVSGWVAGVGFALLAVSFTGVAVVARRRIRRGVPLPGQFYAVLSAQVLWFTIGFYQPFFAITLVPVFHSLQYLGLTSWHACHGKGDVGPRRFAGYVVVVLLLGLAINPGVFLLFGDIGAAKGLVIAAAINSFVNLHHFLLDGRIWRLRERPLGQSMIA
jgi:hypothetical protein